MRLDIAQKNALKTSLKYLDANDEAFLFGSRVDNNKLGGDIDLLSLAKLFTFT